MDNEYGPGKCPHGQAVELVECPVCEAISSAPLGVWTHIAATNDGVYVNGVKQECK